MSAGRCVASVLRPPLIVTWLTLHLDPLGDAALHCLLSQGTNVAQSTTRARSTKHSRAKKMEVWLVEMGRDDGAREKELSN